MRRTLRLLAVAKPGRYLEANTPTGLAGLSTHPSPRSALLYTYNTTLDKLKEFPESSLYRQSTEALTKHRLEIVSKVEPEGMKEWMKKTEELVKSHPEVFKTLESSGQTNGGRYGKIVRGGKEFVVVKKVREIDETANEWDGEENPGPALEGTRTSEERADQKHFAVRSSGGAAKRIELDPEPQLTLEQIEDLESKLGAGLIEEVIQVAEGELKLVETMYQAKVWEDLEEKPVEGQWAYFMRDTGTPMTQGPPPK